MDIFAWLAIGFILLGLCALLVIKIVLKDPTEKHLFWLIGGTTVWGIVSVLLVPWLFGRF